MAIEPPPAPDVVATSGEAIAALHVATTEALAAWEALQEARQAEIRWQAACKALESAWQRTGLRGGPTSIDDALEAMKLGVELGRVDVATASPNGATNIPEIIPDAPDDGVRGAIEEATGDAGYVDVDAIAAEAVELREPTPPAGGGPGSTLGRQQQQILAATIAHSGDRRAVSTELGLSINHIETQLEYIGKKGLLPVDLIAKLPARFAKYSAVER